MALGPGEIFVIVIGGLLLFKVLSKEQIDDVKEKAIVSLKNIKEFEFEMRDDIDEIESKLKEKRQLHITNSE